MRPGMRMLAMTSMRREGEMLRSRDDNREYETNRYERNGNGTNYGVEGRFLDRRGREYYDNGRYSPMNVQYPDPVYRERPRNQIGFAPNDEMSSGYRMNAEYNRIYELDHMPGRMDRSHGYAAGIQPFDHQIAMQWTQKMQNEDGSKGPHWAMDQVKPYMEQVGAKSDHVEFWAIMNAMYSDYVKVLKKYGLDRPEVYADLAKAWIEDKDAMPDKAALYYEYIVKH